MITESHGKILKFKKFKNEVALELLLRAKKSLDALEFSVAWVLVALIILQYVASVCTRAGRVREQVQYSSVH